MSRREWKAQGIAALDVPLPVLEAEIAALRSHLPLTDPDRHALDVDADRMFAALAAAHPEACTRRPDWTPGEAK